MWDLKCTTKQISQSLHIKDDENHSLKKDLLLVVKIHIVGIENFF